MGSGSIITQVLVAQKILEEMQISTDVWSVTSYNELSRNGFDVDRWNRLHPKEEARIPYIQTLIQDEIGIFISVSDFQKSLGSSISPWMPVNYTVLGTDGYGLSEARPELRDHFEISPIYVVLAALDQLKKTGVLSIDEVAEFILKVGIDGEKINPAKI